MLIFVIIYAKRKIMYKYLFGPVPSRRLGMSLGVDLVTHKICSLNCVYCECGETTLLTTERKEYVPFDEVIRELKHFTANNPAPDYMTFSGSGEPTLNSRIGDVISFIKENFPEIKIAVLTNGTLLSDKQVRASLLNADLVLPSLDVATSHDFKKLNMPAKLLNINEYINGIKAFSREFQGVLWLEIFILKEYNDNDENLFELKKVLNEIKPDKIQLNTLDRPGVLSDIDAVNYDDLNKIKDYFGFDNVEIIASATKRKDTKVFRNDIENAILETISRRPCTLEDMENILGLHKNEINKYLSTLEAVGRIETIKMNRGVFYQSK